MSVPGVGSEASASASFYDAGANAWQAGVSVFTGGVNLIAGGLQGACSLANKVFSDKIRHYFLDPFSVLPELAILYFSEPGAVIEFCDNYTLDVMEKGTGTSVKRTASTQKHEDLHNLRESIFVVIECLKPWNQKTKDEKNIRQVFEYAYGGLSKIKDHYKEQNIMDAAQVLEWPMLYLWTALNNPKGWEAIKKFRELDLPLQEGHPGKKEEKLYRNQELIGELYSIWMDAEEKPLLAVCRALKKVEEGRSMKAAKDLLDSTNKEAAKAISKALGIKPRVDPLAELRRSQVEAEVKEERAAAGASEVKESEEGIVVVDVEREDGAPSDMGAVKSVANEGEAHEEKVEPKASVEEDKAEANPPPEVVKKKEKEEVSVEPVAKGGKGGENKKKNKKTGKKN